MVGLGARDDRALHRRNGHLVPAGTEAERYSTPEMITVEQRVLASVARRQAARAGIADPDAVGRRVGSPPDDLGRTGSHGARPVPSGAGVDLVEGVAGSGKTFAFAAAHDAWTASGFTVSGVCLAAKTARRLEDNTGIPSTTVDALLMKLLRSRLEPSDVVVVDEAAMVGTRKLERLLAHAEGAGAKVVLIGDPCQLPEIDAGGAFAGLARRFGAFELTENRRQHHAWERAALGQLRDGNPDLAIDAFVDHDRIHIADTVDQLSAHLVDDWWTARQNGERRAHVRTHPPPRRRAQPPGPPAPDRRRPAHRARGADRRPRLRRRRPVLALRNDRRVGILNGDTAVITGIDPERREITVAQRARASAHPVRLRRAVAHPRLRHHHPQSPRRDRRPHLRPRRRHRDAPTPLHLALPRPHQQRPVHDHRGLAHRDPPRPRTRDRPDRRAPRRRASRRSPAPRPRQRRRPLHPHRGPARRRTPAVEDPRLRTTRPQPTPPEGDRPDPRSATRARRRHRAPRCDRVAARGHGANWEADSTPGPVPGSRISATGTRT